MTPATLSIGAFSRATRMSVKMLALTPVDEQFCDCEKRSSVSVKWLAAQ